MTVPAQFVRSNTVLTASSLVPEIRLHLATEILPLWNKTEDEIEKNGLPPPYWAFAWPGGQALARHILDHPDYVRGRRVLDIGAGSGLVAVAAAMAGAARSEAAEIDPFSLAAIAMNAEENGAAVEILGDDVIGTASRWDALLVGDMCYERPLAERLTTWLEACAQAGALVLLGDPGRAYLPRTGLKEVARYRVPTSLDLEDRVERETIVWRLGL